MQELISEITAAIESFIVSTDKREYVIVYVECVFDRLLAPLDLPGPDHIIVPLLRTAIRPLVGRMYDAALAKIKADKA